MAEPEFESSSDDEGRMSQARYYLRLRSDGLVLGHFECSEDSSEEEEDEEERTSSFRSNPLLMLLRSLAGSVGASGRRTRRQSRGAAGNTSDGAQCQRKTPKQEPAQVNNPIPESEDIVQQVKLQCGVPLHSSSTTTSKRPKMQPTNLLQKLHQREYGGLRQISAATEKRTFNEHCLPTELSMSQPSSSRVYIGKYSKNGELFMSTNQAGTIAVYSCERDGFTLFRNIQARYVGWAVIETAISPDGCSLAYCTWCPLLHHCNIFGDSVNHHALDLRPEEDSFGVFGLTYSYDGMELMASATDGCFYVYDLYKGERVLRVPAHEDHVDSLCSDSDNSHMIYSGGDDGLCKVWDRRTLSEERPLPVGKFSGHRDGITFIDVKGDGRYLITNSKDQSIKLWDMRKFSGNEGIQATRKAVSRQMWDYRWQHAPQHLMRKMKQSKLSGDSSVMTYIGHTVQHTLIRCRFSPSHTTGQRYIYTGGGDGKTIVYDVLTGDIVRSLCDPHRKVVRDVSWHPYRQELATSCWSGTVNVWTPSKLQMVCSEVPEEEEEDGAQFYPYYDSSD